MRSRLFRLILAATVVLSATIFAGADPIRGADSVADLYSAAFLGGGAFSTSTGSAQADAINPAASGEEQRIILDAGYAALVGLGSESGLGHALNLGGVLPTRYAVFAGSLRFLTSPFDSFPVGTGVSLNASAAKELYPGLSAGLGLGGAFGSDWSLDLDIGLRHRMGDIAFMKDFRWAAVLGGIGKGWAPSAFTPTLGAAFTLVEAPRFSLGLSADLSAPSFANFAGRLGLNANIARFATLSSSIGFNAAEAAAGTAVSAVPSFGLTLNFTLAGTEHAGAAARSTASDGEIATTVALRPLYGGAWTFGTGVIATLGVVDKSPPSIAVDYGDPLWISPNNDGKADALEFAFTISDSRYVMDWAFIVENQRGEVVRIVRNKERRPENEGFRDLVSRITDVKSGVEIPKALRWDGVGDTGALSPDGTYYFRIEATDDNGNRAATRKYELHIDTAPPSVLVDQGKDASARIFSPDGDGNKDAFIIEQSGSIEDSWKAGIIDSSGTIVRTFSFLKAAPPDIEWDGKDDSGRVVPDGVYRYEIAAADRALNEGRARLDNIIVNTERPPVNVMIDEAFFSPNGDGIKDRLVFSPGVPVKEGLIAWTLEVRDRTEAPRRTFNGGADVPAAIAFDGRTDTGLAAPEGSYQGTFVARYRNGYEARAKSPVFTIDITPPAINVLRPGAEALRTFSPDGDGRKDTYAFVQSGSREDLWTAKIESASGKLVRTKTWEGTEPGDFIWDGTDDSGRPVPDGVYRYTIAAQDRAGNASAAGVEGIIVDTSKPTVGVAISGGFFSPNGDGQMDELVLTLNAQSAGAAESWRLEIVEDGETTAKKTIAGRGAPDEKVALDGKDDRGQALSEKAYRARLSVSYRNGFIANALSPLFVLDVTPPNAIVSADFEGFSPNGDGNLDEMLFTQSGSADAAWIGEILKDGKIVRTFPATAALNQKAAWDGLDAAGKLSADGMYEYRISGIDRAGNRGASRPVPFRLSTEDTPVLLLVDQRAFSPNGDGIKDNITITPQAQLLDGIASWRVEILDSAAVPVRSFEGSGNPVSIRWDGKDSKGGVVQDGTYTARTEVRYTLGNRPTAMSTPFAVDTVPPSISLSVAEKTFSPNGDGIKDSLTIRRRSSADEWRLIAAKAERAGGSASSAAVRTWLWNGEGGDLDWNGKDDAGNIVPDGLYVLIAEAQDLAGNQLRMEVSGIIVDTQAPSIALSAPYLAFSPNGDGIKDRLIINQQTEGDDSWEGALIGQDGRIVRSFTWKGPANSILWDGRDDRGVQSPDGAYRYIVRSSDAAGNRTERTIDGILLDTRAPGIELSFPFTIFSPNGDGRKDSLTPSIKTEGDDEWEAMIVDGRGSAVATWKWKGTAPNVEWNGKDAAGNIVADGSYRFLVRSEDVAGNRTARTIDGLIVDNRPTRVFVTSSAHGLSPNGDRAFDDIRFGLVVNLKEGIEEWKIEIIEENGTVRRTLGPGGEPGAAADAIPDSIVWNGRDPNGSVHEGRFSAKFSVLYRKGDLATAVVGPFVVDITPPALSLTSTPKWFSPDNDGIEDELSISLSARDSSPLESWALEIKEPQPPATAFYKVDGKGAPTSRIVWDGRSQKGELVQAATDYPIMFSSTDIWGNTSKIESMIGVDVLVIREGDILKIKVPSIIFRENGDDFGGLAQETVDNNLRVLRRIAQILNKFRDYKVKVEGHANPVFRTAAEERNELQPLSEKRARAVLTKLVEFGVDSARLSSIGMGGTRPVVKWEDRADWWKNRRVEFILMK